MAATLSLYIGDYARAFFGYSESQSFVPSQDYTMPWTGYSVATPHLDSKSTYKALHWALASAQMATPTPTCTILFLPQCATHAHTSLLNHPWVHKLTTLPKQASPYLPRIPGCMGASSPNSPTT